MISVAIAHFAADAIRTYSTRGTLLRSRFRRLTDTHGFAQVVDIFGFGDVASALGAYIEYNLGARKPIRAAFQHLDGLVFVYEEADEGGPKRGAVSEVTLHVDVVNVRSAEHTHRVLSGPRTAPRMLAAATCGWAACKCAPCCGVFHDIVYL